MGARARSMVGGVLLLMVGGSLWGTPAQAAGPLSAHPAGPGARTTCANPNPIPFHPDFQVRHTTGTAPLSVVFQSLGDQGPCPIVSTSVDFGDHASATGGATLDVPHTYAKPGLYRISVTETDDTGATASDDLTTLLGGVYAADGPQRILDTRFGTGTAKRPVPPGGTLRLKVTGSKGVPAAGVTAVVLNLTATGSTGAGFITTHPGGSSTPNTSNLNFARDQTISNSVVVPVASDGTIDLTNSGGDSTDLLADLQGYYTVSGGPSAGFYDNIGLTTRLLDTRQSNAVHTGALGPGQSITLPVPFRSADDPGASAPNAATLRITTTAATANGYVTASDSAGAPGTSTVNFTADQTISNVAVVPLDANGAVHLYNHTGRTQVIVDLLGTFSTTAGEGAGEYTPITPERVLDTRNGTGAPTAKLQPDQFLQVDLPSSANLPIGSAVVNLTATRATTDTYLNVFAWADTTAPPSPFASVTVGPGQTVSSLTETSLDYTYGTAFHFEVLNPRGDVDAIADVEGYYS
ncbi:PKD domain-containing protein [Streptacidiphilus sp. P02-A3a]|uniref:PKD domain-containing protein n=1 Tax=Streptacidiphilus sp. P02-A3a TaxID=2704468 RepID=UPI0015FD5233|nr:PKD domain-containing protein [Streptacidiphilus sp. P02-A3a]QMU67175.1 hypothetical protein GXP74_02070 [Streptacidiphilus sp. P02-A3a]